GTRAAALVGVDAPHPHEGLGKGHGPVHHDAPRRPDHGALALGSLDVHGDVDLVRGEDGRRGSAGHHALELAAAANAATVLVDELPESDAHGRLDHAGLLHVTGNGVEPRATLALGAETREPLRAPVDDVRHRRAGLHGVDDGGMAEGALHGGEGRLDLGPALLALERGEEARLLPADVSPRAPMQHHVKVHAGALDVLAEQAGRVSLADGAVEDPPRLHVLAADIYEAQMRADGARWYDHG